MTDRDRGPSPSADGVDEHHVGKSAGLVPSFSYALRGVRTAVVHERNVHVDLVFAVLAVIAAALLRCEPLEWCVIVILIGMVISAEVFNTAIEAVVDLVTADYHALAERAKDVAAGAVLICAMTAVVVGLIVFVNAFARLVG